MINISRFAGILSSTCFCIILICIYFLASNPGANHYEISIYEEYPWYFWWMIIFVICSAQTVLLCSAFIPRIRGLSTYAAFLAMIMADAILLFIPLIRGYTVYGSGDVLTHIGYIKDILSTGYYGKNFYPIGHIFCASITMLTGISPLKLMTIIPQIFSLFFIFSFYILYKSIFSNQRLVFAGLAFSSVLILQNGNFSFSPNAEAFLILPVILYVFLKRFHKINRIQYSILTLLFIFIITLYHPLIALLLALIYLVFDASVYISKKFLIYMNDLKIRTSIYIVIIILNIFYIWDDYIYLFTNIIKNIYIWLGGRSSVNSNLMDYTSTLEKADIPAMDFLRTAFDIFGVYLITVMASIICIIYVIKMFKTNDKYLNINHVFFSLGALIFLSLPILSFIVPTGFSFTRILDMEIIFFLILVPLITYAIISKLEANSRRTIVSILIVIAILMLPLAYSCVYSSYLSPRVRAAGQHVPDTNIIGMERFFEIRNQDFLILEYGISQTRYYDAIYGVEHRPPNVINYESEIYKEKLHLPAHFGYNNRTLLGSYYDSPRYLLLTLYSRIAYTKMYPEFKDKWKYFPSDFDLLEIDKSVNKIYANSGLDAYLVDAI